MISVKANLFCIKGLRAVNVRYWNRDEFKFPINESVLLSVP